MPKAVRSQMLGPGDHFPVSSPDPGRRLPVSLVSAMTGVILTLFFQRILTRLHVLGSRVQQCLGPGSEESSLPK